MEWWHRSPGAVLGVLGAFALAAGTWGAAVATAQTPRAITLQAPARGAVVGSPVEVRGRVTVGPFENTLRGRVYDAGGRVVGEGPVMVSPDAPGTVGGPGTFVGRLAFAAGAGTGRVEVADLSARDGAVLASATVDVALAGPGLPRTGAAAPAAGIAAGAIGPVTLLGVLACAARSRRALGGRGALPSHRGGAVDPGTNRERHQGRGARKP